MVSYNCGLHWQNTHNISPLQTHPIIRSLGAGDCFHHPEHHNEHNQSVQYYVHRESLSDLPGGGAVVFRGSGGEGDSCGQISSLLVLVLTLLGRDCGELRTSPAPPQQRRLSVQWTLR